MAQRMITQLIDDLDGKELADGKGETVTFALDGTSYEIDLSLKNADALRGTFQDYIAAGRRIGRASGRPARRSPEGPSAREIRDWAKSNGYEVPDRGRIPAELREAFDAKSK